MPWWPFRRRESSPAPVDAAARTATAPEPAASRPRGEWASLPPIQRAVQATPFTAPAREFLDALRAERTLPPVLEALGHEVTASAPSGTVTGLATAIPAAPVPSLTSTAPLVHRAPVQRAAAGDAPGPSATTRPSAGLRWTSGPVEPAPADTESAPSVPPIRHLEAVVASAVTAPPPAPLTRAPSALHPVEGPTRPARAVTPALQRSTAAPPTTGAPIAGAPAPRLPSGVSSPAPTPGAASWATTLTLPRPADDDGRQRLNVGQRRRLGLGAPVQRDALDGPAASSPTSASSPSPASTARAALQAVLPAGTTAGPASEERPAAAAPSPATGGIPLPLQRTAAQLNAASHSEGAGTRNGGAARPDPPVQSAGVGTAPVAASAGSHPGPEQAGWSGPAPMADPLARLPRLPLADGRRSLSIQRAAATGPASTRGADRVQAIGPSSGPLAGAGPTTVVPIVGERPIEPIGGAPGRPGTDAFGSGSADGIVGDVPIHRGPLASDAADQLGARAFATAGEIFLPGSHGPLDSPPVQRLLAHELTHVEQQRAGRAVPDEGSGTGQHLEREAQQAESLAGTLPSPGRSLPPSVQRAVAAAAGRSSIERSSSQALALRPPAAAGEATAAPRSFSWSSPGPGLGDAAASASWPDASVQRSTTPEEPSVQREPAAGPEPGAGSTAPAAAPAQSDEEIDVLFGRLYDRWRIAFRNDLVVDREAHGFAFDAR